MDQPTTKAKILAAGAMVAKLRRMAYQVYEKNFDQSSLTLVGIGFKGYAMAKLLGALLEEISPLEIHLLHLQKDAEQSPLAYATGEADALIRSKHVLIVDDVLYSGYTLFQALAATMSFRPRKVELAVLIDRGHHMVPISPNYVGMVLATSFLQYVAVEFEEDQSRASAYLY